MNSNLMNIRNYGIITFGSTSYALKAEKIMKRMEKTFMVIPTPREISASCGLAIKLETGLLDEYLQILAREKVSVEEVYRIEEEGRKKILHKVILDSN
ncbi:hypothetical protein ASZ90_018634 [hydrocarbon metagenome]|uniref:Putative Se/S carrier protein-like domain-containing protein n=1 Tax=hydrocarbon metagenome TaxID=938273 RepID=A0A0W8E6H6_9ZZZZ